MKIRVTIGGNSRGQSTMEYVVVFAVLAAVILYAGVHIIKPAACSYYDTAGFAFDRATNVVRRNFATPGNATAGNNTTIIINTTVGDNTTPMANTT